MKYRLKLKNKHPSGGTKTHFPAYLGSKLETVNDIETLENEIDVFQRILLRNIMGYRYTENREYWP